MPEAEKKETSDDKAKAELDELFGSGSPQEEIGIPEGIPIPPGEEESEDHPWDFVERYVDYMHDITDAPDDFQEAAAIYLISTFAGKNFTFLSLPEAPKFRKDAGFGGKNLNVWFILIGKSRISRKSTVIGSAEEMIDLISEDLKLPFDFTPQALIKTMHDMSDGKITRATWINDECSGFFEQLRKTDFMVTTDTVLSRLYDGHSYKRTTLKRGEETVSDPYVTMLLSSTEHLPGLFDVSRMRQGFLNRFIFIPSRKERSIELRMSLTEDEGIQRDRIVEWCQTLFTLQSSYVVSMNSDAKALYDAFEKKIERDIAEQDLGIKEGYRGNLPNFLLRIASLFRISRMPMEDLMGYAHPILVVEERDMRRGIAYMEKIWDWFEIVVTLFRTNTTSKPALTDEATLEMVLSYIPPEGIQHTVLWKKTGLLGKFKQVIDTLLEGHRIVSEKRNVGNRRGPKAIFYRLVTDDEETDKSKLE